MVTQTKDTQPIWEYLKEIPDPEIPVINIIELGVIRDIKWNDDELEVIITPTYSGCPAMQEMEDDIVKVLNKHGYTKHKVTTVLSPSWTTDWMNEEAREKLRVYGIAPPMKGTADKGVLFGKMKAVTCPHCGSGDTEMKSQFGSTACKALYQCNSCKEPFDYFKCI